VSGSETVLDVAIECERFTIHDVQPLPNELLLACARSFYKGPDDFEKNGRIDTRDGEFLREILLGDGIQTVQAMSSGVIWTSYFDEGVFGNYGWTDPVGAPRGRLLSAIWSPQETTRPRVCRRSVLLGRRGTQIARSAPTNRGYCVNS